MDLSLQLPGLPQEITEAQLEANIVDQSVMDGPAQVLCTQRAQVAIIHDQAHFSLKSQPGEGYASRLALNLRLTAVACDGDTAAMYINMEEILISELCSGSLIRLTRIV